MKQLERRTHQERIKAELRAAGASKYGLLKFASRYLPELIHHDEHIMAAVYGRQITAANLFGLTTGMLVATDKRVIYLDHKPGFTTTDEISYDVVSGVRMDSSRFACTVTLHTRIKEYTIFYANVPGAQRFVRFIDKEYIELSVGADQIRQFELSHAPKAAPEPPKPTKPASTKKPSEPASKVLNSDVLQFLRQQTIGVLSTIDRSGNAHGAVLYYYLDKKGQVCIVTKAATNKARNIFANNNVSLTVYDAASAETVQLQGHAKVVSDPAHRQEIIDRLVTPQIYTQGVKMPPVTTIHQDAFVAMTITPTSAVYTNYQAVE